nr:MAG TPA: hypothetical protein [Caudoviricetes sp.]
MIKTSTQAEIREKAIFDISAIYRARGDDIQRIKSNAFAVPQVTDEGAEYWLEVTVKIPRGGRDGVEYDGYELAQEYAMKLDEKAEKKSKKV